MVYKVDPSGVETVLYNFVGGPGGYAPLAGVIEDEAGTVYGTTERGGPADVGVVYEINSDGARALHRFTGGADGAKPQAGVIRDSAGNLYGTTPAGGLADAGVVYTLDTTGRETVLYSFTDGADGAYPQAGVIRDAEGNLYGTTLEGGANNLGCVYKLDSTGNETVLYSFKGSPDGRYPSGAVVRDRDGNLFGTTQFGGAIWDARTVYKLDPAGNETILHRFGDDGDGASPIAGLVLDAVGNLYGTTPYGGRSLVGVVYKVDVHGNETVLHSFSFGGDGAVPAGSIILDAKGNLYGATSKGGAFGQGTVFTLDPAGDESVIYSFTGGADGSSPQAGVFLDTTGNLTGTNVFRDRLVSGVVFKLTSP